MPGGTGNTGKQLPRRRFSGASVTASPTADPGPTGATRDKGDHLVSDPVDSRILIVDDDAVVLSMVARMASCLGYAPTTASDAVDALYHLNRAPFGTVITDYTLPTTDGYQLAVKIKKKYFGTRVIIMTGHCPEEILGRCEAAGMVDGILLKPFSLTVMKATLLDCDRPVVTGW